MKWGLDKTSRKGFKCGPQRGEQRKVTKRVPLAASKTTVREMNQSVGNKPQLAYIFQVQQETRFHSQPSCSMSQQKNKTRTLQYACIRQRGSHTKLYCRKFQKNKKKTCQTVFIEKLKMFQQNVQKQSQNVFFNGNQLLKKLLPINKKQ